MTLLDTRPFLLKLPVFFGLITSTLIFTSVAYSAEETKNTQDTTLSSNSQDKEKNNRVPLGDGIGKADIPMERSLTGFDNVDATLSLWEFGAGGGAFYNPKYPASSEGRVFGLVLPFVVYRGETFRIGDGGGARAIIIENETFEIDFSFDAALPSDSEDNSARIGMPELDFLGEIGPQMIFMLGKYDFDKNAKGENIGTNIGKGRLDLFCPPTLVTLMLAALFLNRKYLTNTVASNTKILHLIFHLVLFLPPNKHMTIFMKFVPNSPLRLARPMMLRRAT
jgi:hypothetical protein